VGSPNKRATFAVALLFGDPTGFIQTPRFDHRMSGEHPVGRRAILWHGGPAGPRSSQRQCDDRAIPVAIRSPPSWWLFCLATPRVSFEFLGSTTRCPGDILLDAVPSYGTAGPQGRGHRRGSAMTAQSPWRFVHNLHGGSFVWRPHGYHSTSSVRQQDVRGTSCWTPCHLMARRARRAEVIAETM